MHQAPHPPSPLIADAASRCRCRARWKASAWFLLDWSIWCHQEICSKKAIQRQTVHYFPAWLPLVQEYFTRMIAPLTRSILEWYFMQIQQTHCIPIICISDTIIIIKQNKRTVYGMMGHALSRKWGICIKQSKQRRTSWIHKIWTLRMSEPNQETGFRLAGFKCMMKAGTNGQSRDSIRRPPANFDCTISVG